MYDSVFGFESAPFSAVVEWRQCSTVPSFRSAISEILNCLTGGRGVAVLTAPAGLGKSLACQLIAEELASDFRVVHLTSGGYKSRSAFLQATLFELGVPFQGLNEQELRLHITAAVRELGCQQSALALLVDEAHTISGAVLEELRAMTNLVGDGQPLVRILLSGQLALEEALASPQLDALNQRVGCHATLEPLTRAESAAFIEEKIRQSGASPDDIFTPDAIRTITIAADGNPRCLNQLCDRSLTIAAQYGVRPVPDGIVRRALADLKQLPLHWNEPPPADGDTVSRDLDDSKTTPTDIGDLETDTSDQNSLTKDESIGPIETRLEQEVSNAAVFEFGADDDMPATPISETAITAEQNQTRSTFPEIGIPAENKQPLNTDEFSDGIFEIGSPPLAESPTSEPVTSTVCNEDWETVEAQHLTKSQEPVRDEAPRITFGKSMPAGTLRALSRKRPTIPQTPASDTTRAEEIEVVDHYASLLIEQSRSRGQRKPAASLSLPSQPSTDDDCPSKLVMQDNLPSEPDALVDNVIAAVESVDRNDAPRTKSATVAQESDEQTFDTVFPPDKPRPAIPISDLASAETESPRPELPPLQDLLNEIEYDIVRPLGESEAIETDPGQTRKDAPTESTATRPYVDLFTRLRRLQNSE